MLRFILLLVLLMFCRGAAPPSPQSGLSVSPLPAAPQPKRRVLVIYSYHDTLPWQAKLREALSARLQSVPIEQRPELFEERIEGHRLSNIFSYENFLKLLEAKYSNVKLDLIVTENDYAYTLIEKYPNFFHDVKRLSLTVTQGRDDEALVAHEDGIEAINTVLHVFPSIKRVVAIQTNNDIYGGSLLAQLKIAQASLLAKNIRLDIWDDFSFEELYERARQLPQKDTAILYMPVMQDRLGVTQIPRDVFQRLTAIVNLPIFVHHDTFLGFGAFGGYMVSASKFGDLLGRIVLGQDLPKTRAEIDAATKGYYFDDKELQRWGVDDSRLPIGSIIINRKHSIAYTYRWQIAATLLALALESLLIIALFQSLYLRKQATLLLAQERDLLEQRVAERTSELAESRNLFQEAAKVAKFGVFDYDLVTDELKWDDSMFFIYGVKQSEFCVSYNAWRNLLLPEDCITVEIALRHAIRGQDEFNTDFRIKLGNGEIATIYALGQVYRDSAGQPLRIVCFNQDITERKASEKRINYLAFYDPLTGLPNRRLLQERLKYNIELGRREGKSMAVLMLDLDRFKAVNDGLGHTSGDELLTQVAARLSSRLRDIDTVARLGGDEFTILLSNITHQEDVGKIAQAIIEDLARPFQLSQSDDVRIGASIGISLYPQHDNTPEKLMDHADLALYQAKKEGRGCFAYFSEELTAHVHNRIALESRLRKAIEQQELRVYYQPQVDIASGKIIGAEALVRWHHPEQGLIPPVRFIPIAEESGLIIAIGEWVLYETCRQGRAWLDAGLLPLTLAVNVSSHQFRYSNITNLVASILEKTGFPACQLELEMTESSLMEDQDNVIAVLSGLRAQGIRLAIDDFGTGYSSLAYLKKFPVDVLKIDKSFIDDIPYDQSDTEIAATIISMGHVLGFKVLAEGVETVEQLAFLREKGCDIYQGYIKSKPLPAEGFMQLMRDQA
ncbi:MAG: EAL domain-containing protein [Methylovulum sp.]|nr:EAL domain-containing protein [Methylovulum sp.]